MCLLHRSNIAAIGLIDPCNPLNLYESTLYCDCSACRRHHSWHLRPSFLHPSPKRCTSTMMAESTTRTFSVKSRCARNRHSGPRAGIQGGGAFVCCPPTIVSLANSLLPRPTLYLQPSPCVRHFAHPMSLGRPNVHPGRTTSSKPDPLAPTYLEKSVTLARHPSPAQPHPIPLTSHLFPTPAPFLPINPAQSRNFASPLEAYAHTCYPRPREGPTQRPGIRPPSGVLAPGISRGVPRGPLWQ